MMRVQQCPHQTRGPMEGRFHHPTRAIWTEHYVLWNVQLPSHFPSIHGESLWRLYHRGLVGNLYGRSTNPLLEPGNTPWMHSESSTTVLRTRNIPQAGKIHILNWRSGISQIDNRKRRSTDVPCQTQSYPRMVPTSQRQGCMILSRVLQLLSEIHPFLLWHCPLPPGPY